MCMYDSRKTLPRHSVGKKNKPSLQRIEVKDIYILTHEVISTLTLQKTSSKQFNLFAFQLFIHNIEIYELHSWWFYLIAREGKISERRQSIFSLSPAHPQGFFTGFVNTLPCDEKESTETGWREVGSRSFRMKNVWNTWLCNGLYRGCEPLISLDSCCEDYVTVVK